MIFESYKIIEGYLRNNVLAPLKSSQWKVLNIPNIADEICRFTGTKPKVRYTAEKRYLQLLCLIETKFLSNAFEQKTSMELRV